MFGALLDGWRVQQASRHLERRTIKQRTDLVCRAVRHLGEWPWEWTPLAVEEFIVDVAANGLARSTIRNYQGNLKVFLDYLCDTRYPWVEICEQEFGVCPRQVFDNQDLTRHLAELEGDPQNRPLTLVDDDRLGLIARLLHDDDLELPDACRWAPHPPLRPTTRTHHPPPH